MDLNLIKRELISDNSGIRERALKKTRRIPNEKAIIIFSKLLYHKNPSVRMTAASGLRKIKDEKVAMCLMRAMLSPLNKSYKGSLVYALQSQDCRKYFMPILKLALYSNYEAQCHALAIISVQEFIISSEEHSKARRWLALYRKRKKKYGNYQRLLEEIDLSMQKNVQVVEPNK